MESESDSVEGDCESRHVLLLDCTLNLVLCGFGFVQFKLQLKFCLYTIVHLSLEELRISLKPSLSTQSVCHTVSPRVRVGV